MNKRYIASFRVAWIFNVLTSEMHYVQAMYHVQIFTYIQQLTRHKNSMLNSTPLNTCQDPFVKNTHRNQVVLQCFRYHENSGLRRVASTYEFFQWTRFARYLDCKSTQ